MQGVSGVDTSTTIRVDILSAGVCCTVEGKALRSEPACGGERDQET